MDIPSFSSKSQTSKHYFNAKCTIEMPKSYFIKNYYAS